MPLHVSRLICNPSELSLHHYHRRLKVLCIFVKVPTCADPENCVKVEGLFFCQRISQRDVYQEAIGPLTYTFKQIWGQILGKVFKHITVTFTDQCLQLHYSNLTRKNVMITITITFEM